MAVLPSVRASSASRFRSSRVVAPARPRPARLVPFAAGCTVFAVALHRFGRSRDCRANGRQMRSVAVHALQSIQKVASQTEQSWLERLTADPEMEANQPNHSPRQVTSGHYVEVLPTPLPSPELVIYSPEVAEMLEIPPEEIESEAFKAFFSGDQSQVPNLKSWCTPYALAIMGQRMVSNCPFGNGNGYGDGRAISVGELLTASGRYEMQLKGAGRTPFCRGGDGRAVLRSSVREFLASEAMHHLGVETTRALCLIVSHGETARRAWYSGAPAGGMFGGSREPDTVIDEPCAISTRVSPSFLRVGHVDLFARRAAGSSESMAELEQIVEHALFREYPQIAERQEPLKEKAILMLEEFPERLGQMVAGWLRCGFCQGNFNSDNCLVGGRTMDYGPFGWIDRYNPLFAKWTGSGEHYGFLNQPQAAIANFHTLLTSVAVLLGDEAQPKVVALMEAGARKIRAAAQDAFRAKLGFEAEEAETALELWKDLEPLMRKSDIDYTIFWRQLAAVLECAESDQLQQIEPAFYKAPSKELAEEWQAWLQRWADTVGDAQEVTARLRAVNPKYVPREWMLAEAYDKAAQGDYSLVSELLELFRHPYDEQPAFEAKYFSRGPEEKVNQGGIAYMT